MFLFVMQELKYLKSFYINKWSLLCSFKFHLGVAIVPVAPLINPPLIVPYAVAT